MTVRLRMVYYRGEPLARQTLDMIVDEKVVIENKATEHLHPGAHLQLFSYLSATDLTRLSCTACAARLAAQSTRKKERRPARAPAFLF